MQFDFRDADLREATLVRGDFTNSDFTNARINGLVLGDFTLAFSQLACTSDYRQRGLRIAVLPCGPYAKGFLGRCDFSGINLHGSYFAWLPADAIFTDARINRCAIRGLTKEQLCSTASYKEGNISGLRLMNADLSGCDFSGMNLSDCCFEQCRLAGAKFDDAVITGVRFLGGKSDPAFVLTFEQLKSTWNWKHGRMAGIALYGFPETARALPEHVRQQMRIGP
ncbi:MAG: pentapeptide repeat-containing protein [Synergistales bacterium]|nr:pentapeptide repeat-containing protein [Synergistales bacterium]